MKQALYPWNAGLWQTLARDAADRGHAKLLVGPNGLGKLNLATHYAHWLLCKKPETEAACGQCRSCQLFAAGNHPDFHVLQPETKVVGESSIVASHALRYLPEIGSRSRKPRGVISVDQVRLLIEALTTHTHQGGRRVVLLAPAECLNVNAANALLKVLEEPPAGTVFILVSAHPQRLPATVRSRCGQWECPVPPTDQALAWLAAIGDGANAELALKVAGGVPLRAASLLEQDQLSARNEWFQGLEQLTSAQGDPTVVVEQWLGAEPNTLIEWLQGLLADAIRLGSARETQNLFNPDRLQWLQAWVKQIDLKKLFELADSVAKVRRELDSPLDKRLMFEDIAIRFQELTRAGVKAQHG